MRYLLAIAITAACGYPPLEGAGVDAPPVGGDGKTCPAPATYGSPTMAAQQAAFAPGDGSTTTDVIFYDGLMGTDILFVYLVRGGGAFPNGFVPATVQLTGAESNFGSCSACVVVASKCNNCRPEDAQGTGEYYMATGGTLRLTTANTTRITGTLTNATFVHVTIENTGPAPTLISHPIADGCTTQIASASFTSPVTQ